jgi:hypothetical protein
MYDIHVVPIWEILNGLMRGPMAHVAEKIQMKENAPNVLSYVERF